MIKQVSTRSLECTGRLRHCVAQRGRLRGRRARACLTIMDGRTVGDPPVPASPPPPPLFSCVCARRQAGHAGDALHHGGARGPRCAYYEPQQQPCRAPLESGVGTARHASSRTTRHDTTLVIDCVQLEGNTRCVGSPPDSPPHTIERPQHVPCSRACVRARARAHKQASKQKNAAGTCSVSDLRLRHEQPA